MEYSFEEKMEKHFARQLKKAGIGVGGVSVGCCEGSMTTRVKVLSFEGKSVCEAGFNGTKCLATVEQVIVSNSKALVGLGVAIDTYKATSADHWLVSVDIERV